MALNIQVFKPLHRAVVLGVLFLGVILTASAPAQTVNPITLYLGEGTGNAGDTTEIPVELGVGNTRPTNLVVWLRYNPAKIQPDPNFYEFTARDLDGEPIRDNQGNVITSRGPVRREQNLIDAVKVVDTEIHPEGALGIAIQGINNLSIAPGLLLTVAFKVQPGVAENEVVALEGAEESDPVQFNQGGTLQTAFTTANYQLPNDAQGKLGVEMSDGRVVVPCTPPAAPTGVTATQGQADAVVVSWTAAAGTGVKYRVYRSKTNNFGDATPLGTEAQAATTFQDITAEGPVLPTGGCTCNQQATVVHYFYWVRTVSASGCESSYSTPPADGFRGTAKAASLSAKTALDTLPAMAYDTSANVAYAGQSVAVRLEGAVGGTVYAEAVAEGWSSRAVRWTGDSDGGWASIVLPASLVTGTHVYLTAGAEGIGPYVREFVVAASKKSAAGLSVRDLGADAVPYLPEGVGSVYGIAPAGLLDAPAEIYLPVPAGEDAAALHVYTYVHAQGDRRWYLGENVAGWLAEAPAITSLNGAPHVRIVVRYGATVQLGHAPEAGSEIRTASMAPVDIARMHAGDLLLALMFAAVLAGAWHRRAVQV